MYYKISEEDLLRLERIAYQMENIKVNMGLAWDECPPYDEDDLPSDEDIIEAINCNYEIIE